MLTHKIQVFLYSAILNVHRIVWLLELYANENATENCIQILRIIGFWSNILSDTGIYAPLLYNGIMP